MRLDYLIDRILASIANERMQLRRVTRYIAPLLLLPVGFALAQMARSWLGLLLGGLATMVLLVQIEVFLRPSLMRTRQDARDATYYLGLPRPARPSSLAPVVRLLIPSTLALIASMAVFLPTVLRDAPPLQRLLALAFGVGVLWSLWQRIAEIATLLDDLEQRLLRARPPTPPTQFALSTLSPDGLLEPALAQRVAGLPLPPLKLSPAAQALLRIEAYVLLRDNPDLDERVVLAAVNDLAQIAYQDEQTHRLMPPVGGKLYLPVAAGGTLAHLLGATARRLGMDGAYSASLGTWLVRLPPAYSYRVAGRLLDAVIALRLPPIGSVLPHHLTVQGDIISEANVLSIIHLAASPLIINERPDHAQHDERPFIMRGGGVLDDMAGRGRGKGARTDFVDGFLFAGTPDMQGVEHLIAHTINLRIKQVLAFGASAARRPRDKRAPYEQQAATIYTAFKADLRAFLARYDLAAALDADWVDGNWSDIWPFIARMSTLKEQGTTFLREAQALRDGVLDALEAAAQTRHSSIHE